MKLFLKLEYAALSVAALIAYHQFSGNWWLFALLILAPDLSMLGYLAGPRVGAWCYNIAHTWLTALAVLLTGWLGDSDSTIAVALILVAHICIDRAMGYGLKHESGFKDTHLGRIGRDS
ncbi:DUF4260 domain-containing protein [Nitratireductor aestuarii]|uniref:DUF4260 domain-containing protein n=1 Tax=Nitratireductor aestuarii TaxID=1735103 RepID=UPI0016677824|nr:DUF4260 domain-containing protein [Nitratireductor aestuarii]